MITKNAQPVKLPNTVSAFGKDDDKIAVFSDILGKLAASTNRDVVVPLLKKIEINTSFLKKTAIRNGKTPVSTGERTATARPVTSRRGRFNAPRDEHGRFVSVGGSGKAVAGKARATTDNAAIAKPISSAGRKMQKPAIKEIKSRDPGEIRGEEVAGKQASGAIIRNNREERDRSGRFVSKSQEARAQQQEKKEQKTVLNSLRDSFPNLAGKGRGAIKEGTVEEAAGKAVGGPLFEAAMEIREAVGEVSSKDNMIGKMARRVGGKLGFGMKEDVPEIDNSGRDSKGRFIPAAIGKATDMDDSKKREKREKRRHRELIQAIRSNGVVGGGSESSGMGADLLNMPWKRKAMGPKVPKIPKLPGGMMGRAGGGGMRGIASVATKAPLLAAALPAIGTIGTIITAIGSVGAAGYSAITGKDNFISKGAQSLGLVPKLETDAKGRVIGRANPDKVNRNVLENTMRVNAERRKQGKKELEFDSVTGMVKPIKSSVRTISGRIEPKPVAQPQRLKPMPVGSPAEKTTENMPGGNKDIARLTSSISRLVSNMGAGKKEKDMRTVHTMNIPTEFDDTMLTLMVYDRV